MQYLYKGYPDGDGSIQYATETCQNSGGSDAEALSILEHTASTKNG